MIGAVWAGAAIVAALCSWGWSQLLRRRAFAWGLVDLPNERSSHSEARPKAAGVGLMLGTLVGVAVGVGLGPLAFPGSLWIILSGGAALTVVGLLDDRHDLPVAVRLLTQVAAASVVVATMPWTASADGWSAWSVVLGSVAILGVVGATNIYNFMDGIDGIAGGTGIAIGTTWALLAITQGMDGLFMLGVVTAASCAGFIVLNWSPAKVFMGDSGSLFLGFLAATVPVWLLEQGRDVAVLAGLPLVPFLVDGLLTMARRAMRHESLTTAHRSHLYQEGASRWGHAPVAAVYIGFALLAGLSGLSSVSAGFNAAAYLVLVLAVASAIWAVARARLSFPEPPEAA